MNDELEEHTPDEIARGTTEFMDYLEECDSQECLYTWSALMNGSSLLYDFRNQGD
jgi:hypothetical protein